MPAIEEAEGGAKFTKFSSWSNRVLVCRESVYGFLNHIEITKHYVNTVVLYFQ